MTDARILTGDARVGMHTNYCRQALKQWSEALAVPNCGRERRQVLCHAIDLVGASQKFLLPDGGFGLIDPQLRALDGVDRLRLPHPFVALEYSINERTDPKQSPRGLVLARERAEADCIAVTGVYFSRSDGTWAPSVEISIPRCGALEYDGSGTVKVRTYCNGMADPFGAVQFIPDNFDVVSEVQVLLGFLNALACSNVHIERSPAKKGAKVKNALPFDDYHILTISQPATRGNPVLAHGTHRSPREHLRRGHIRRLESGSKVWVNATVVNAGIGGKVGKDYRLTLGLPLGVA